LKILILGGAGFIGSHLVDKLVALGEEVGVFIKPNTKIWRIKHHIEEKNIKIHIGDILNFKQVKKAMTKYNYAINLVALLHHPKKGYTYKTNYFSALNTFKAALDTKIKKVVHTSTAHVLFKPPIIHDNTNQLYSFQTEYSAGKIAAELLAQKFIRKKKLNISIIRPTITFGPRDNKGLTLLILMTYNGILPIITANPNTKINPIYIADLVDGYIKVIEEENTETYTFAGKTVVTIKDMINYAAKQGRKILPLKYITHKTTKKIIKLTEKIPINTPIPKEANIYQPFYKTNIYTWQKTRKKLKWTPKNTTYQAIQKTTQWIKQNKLTKPTTIIKYIQQKGL